MSLNKLRVLVVDDDPQDVILIEEALSGARRTHFTVDHVGDYQTAREALFDEQYDAYLLDFFLGGETANQLLRDAQRLRITRPVVVLTGAGKDDLDDQVISLGAADFLPKSELSPTLLERIIRHAVEHKRAQVKLEHLVKQDALTGLGNRQLFEDLLERALARGKRKQQKLAVMFLDLDRFKEINDTLGHPVGDLLLILVADRLRKLVRDSDTVARIGGDEFTILLDDIHSYDDAANVAEKIIHSLSQPSAIQGNNLVVSSSVGIAVYPANGQTPIELMQKADMALYEAKRKGAGRYQFFTGNLQTRLEESTRIEKGLREALSHDQLELHLQPKWSLADQRVSGFEALLRWRLPDGQLISPGLFIPIAEKTGLIVPVGDWVIDEACRMLNRWKAQGLTDLSIAINVSPQQLRRPDFCAEFELKIREAGIAPGDLEIELTEETLIDVTDDNESILRDLEHLRRLGMGISIDDFGTGYSSLQYLKHFPVQTLKIDKSFVSGDASEIAEPAIARAVITLAHSLDMKVVAEGIETEAQLDYLQQHGCDEGQGFLVAKPMEEEQALAFALAQNERNDSGQV
ncbi:EAL domain-containing protein [Marinobacteraceae bacterium S3BR75-40.1]